jgi:uncharacterized protein (TIGR03118 family)
MKPRNRSVYFLLFIAIAMVSAAIRSSPAASVSSFKVVKLIGSTGSGAPKRDPHMINAWGNAFLPGGNPFWINDEGSGVSELIDGKGVIFKSLPLVTVPGASGGKGQPTGIVANGTSDFALSSGGPALFMLDTEDGTISGWNEGEGNKAVIVVNRNGSGSYTGLALAQNASANQLYAANQGTMSNPAGSIDVFDANFNPVTPAGGFTDPSLPSGFTPYNITNIDGNLFVSYAKGLNTVGQVDEFDPTGKLIMGFTSNTLKAPWGMAVGPTNFGAFAGALLVGNLIDGTISAFNLANGEFLGQLTDSKSQLIKSPELWSLVVGDGALNAQADAVYFTAGPMGYAQGLFGLIEAGSASTGQRFSTYSLMLSYRD